MSLCGGVCVLVTENHCQYAYNYKTTLGNPDETQLLMQKCCDATFVFVWKATQVHTDGSELNNNGFSQDFLHKCHISGERVAKVSHRIWSILNMNCFQLGGICGFRE